MKKTLSFLKSYYYLSLPFLISLYAVLFLYSKNQNEYLLPVLATPILVSLVYSLLALVICMLVFRKTDRAVLVSAFVVFFSLSYGRFIALINIPYFKLYFIEVSKETIINTIGVLILITLSITIFKIKKSFVKLDEIITFFALCLVMLQVFNIFYFEINSGRANRKQIEPVKIEAKNVKNVKTPDIYYFIFDRYAGPTATSEQYGFDNSEFYNYLKKANFYISDMSRTNYPKTFLSLGSSLNMKYLDFLTGETNGGQSKDESLVKPLIEDSEVLKFLKNKGYSYVHVGSWWEQTKRNKNADYLFAPIFKEYLGADEFTTGFLNTTVFAPLAKVVLHNPLDVSEDMNNNIHRQAAVYQFKALEQVNAIKSPKFVFAHILLPHDPFVFDKNCNAISEKEVNKNTHQENYINQLKCTNTQIKKIIDRLISSNRQPIIILQSDEGPFPMNSPIDQNQAWGKATDTALREKFPILNAYFFPNIEYSNTQLYNSISPVNSFKVLFNTYFGTSFPLDEDRSYVFEDKNNYYKFKDVSNIVK